MPISGQPLIRIGPLTSISARASQQLLERDPEQLERERGAGAAMRSAPEGHVIADVRPVQDELITVREDILVAVGRRVGQRDRLILGHVATAELHVVTSGTGKAAVRGEQTEIFLDRSREQARVLAQLLLQLGMLAQMYDNASEEHDRRDHPDDDELAQRSEHQVLGERLAPFIGGREQGRGRIVLHRQRLGLTRRDHLPGDHV